MKEQFTQGEWVADCYEIECNNQRVAECGYSGAEPDEQEIANAYLIAAAPKMYRMLKEVASIAMVVGTKSEVSMINNLLAEARGENKDTD